MDNMYGRIESLCQTRGITVGKLCALLNISRGTMGDLKAGRTRSLSASNVSKIAQYFSVSTDYLLGSPQDGADIGLMLSMIQEEYGISYDEAIKINQTFTQEWREEKNVHGTYDCFRVYFAEKGIYPKEKALTPDGERPKSKLRSVARLEDSKITPEQDEQIADYIDFLLSKKKNDT